MVTLEEVNCETEPAHRVHLALEEQRGDKATL